MNVLIIVARRYNGHELWVALGILQDRGHTFEVASTAYMIQDEVTGQPNKIHLLVKDVSSIEKYDALMVVSGNMSDTEAYWTDPYAQRIVRAFVEANKPIAGICCSVPTVRQAARGKRVSYFPLIRSRDLLEQAGAVLCNVSVSVDDNLVTAEHQMATQMWTESFCDILEGKTPQISLQESGFEPGRSPRRPDPELDRLRKIVHTTKRRNINGKDIPD